MGFSRITDLELREAENFVAGALAQIEGIPRMSTVAGKLALALKLEAHAGRLRGEAATLSRKGLENGD